MAKETSEEITYPSGEMDLKRRVAGEILRYFEDLGQQPADDDLAALIEVVFADILTRHRHKIEAGRPIGVPAEVKRQLRAS